MIKMMIADAKAAYATHYNIGKIGIQIFFRYIWREP